jgi:hypothetical protein
MKRGALIGKIGQIFGGAFGRVNGNCYLAEDKNILHFVKVGKKIKHRFSLGKPNLGIDLNHLNYRRAS